MKKIFLLAFIVVGAVSLFAGGQSETTEPTEVSQTVDMAEPVTVKFVTPTGHPAISMAEIISGKPEILPGYNVDYTILESPDMLGAKVISGEADLFIAPTNLGANLYGKGKDVRFIGSMVWGILYIVTTEDISTWDDLRGKEISMLGRGLTPDIVFRYLLQANGLDPEKDVTLNYVQATTELAPTFISGRSTISIMPEPALSMVMTKKSNAKILLDLQKEWEAVSGSSESYPQASLYASGKFADSHPEFIKAFTDLYAASLESVVADPQAAASKAATFLSTPPAPIIAKSIPRGNLQWVPAGEARAALETYFKVLHDFAPGTIGGKMPDENFYLKK